MNNNVIIISFSARKGGNCEQIGHYIRTNFCKSCELFAFTNNIIQPCGNCDYECFQNNLACPNIQDEEYTLLDAICCADQAYFVVPNYCDYPCAHFFIFNERSQCYFQGHPERLEQYLRIPKKFIVVSNSESENFREAFVQHTHQEPEILFLSARRYGMGSIDGNIMQSDDAARALREFLTDSF